MKFTILASLLAIRLCAAAEISGEWVAQVSGSGDALYARVTLVAEGSKLIGKWSDSRVEGTVTGSQVRLVLFDPDGTPAGTLNGTGAGKEFSGDGELSIRRRGGPAGAKQHVAWKLTKAPGARAGGPKTFDFTPKEFQRYYSSSIAPVLRVYPGDTVRTWTIDSGGLDSRLERLSPGGNPETGPFYIEGALPGDTLVVKINKLRLNRDTAHSGSRITPHAVDAAFVAAAKYSNDFDSTWKLDREKGIATVANPTARLKNFRVPILPMLGCLATAPAGSLAYRAADLGPYGGNMDYNQMGEGATLYLPVFHPGALFSLGDGHAAMGDGELTGGALETSLDVEFTVDVIQGFATQAPRLENAEYAMSMGIAGSVPDALQSATSQLGNWLKDVYRLNDSELALVLGTVLKYDVTELVDSSYNVVAKVPKSALAGLK
jgi:amidase